MHCKTIFSRCAVLLTLLIVIACATITNGSLLLEKNCPVDFKLADVAHISEYYQRVINQNSQYIAYKEISGSGYVVVSLVNNENAYILSASFAPFQNGTVSRMIEPEFGQSIFDAAVDEMPLANYRGEQSVHTACALIGKKSDNVHSAGSVYHPPLMIQNYTDAQNNSLKLYSMLKSLVETIMPDYKNTILSLNEEALESVVVGKRRLFVDNYQQPSQEESARLKKKLNQMPFFEIEQHMN